MGSLAEKIKSVVVEPGCLAIIWLAQAGFVFKTSDGTILYIDPYLTDYVQRILPEYGMGFKRMMPSLIEPGEVEADVVISTHSHPDHFDADAITIMAKNRKMRFIGAPDCQPLYDRAGISQERYTILHQGETLNQGGLAITGVPADHGDLAPDALGVWLDFDGITVWQVGDSAFRPDLWGEQYARQVDILLPPINGAFGNLNEIEAAKLAGESRAKITIPCHFWMFPLHHGNPNAFLDACQQYAPETIPYLMTQGELFLYRKDR